MMMCLHRFKDEHFYSYGYNLNNEKFSSVSLMFVYILKEWHLLFIVH